jgi:SAM-dependent methyltransferase
MQSLTRREHWDAVHASESVVAPRHVGKGSWFRRALKGLVGRHLAKYASSYDEHQLWNVLCPRHMPSPGASVVEIGSAPGEHLARLGERFGLVPYGIEYSGSGVLVNRAVFLAHGLDPANVMEVDFFSDECLQQCRERFDVVVSRGFIEHFEDPFRVVERHLDLLKPGGLLIVTIPNLRGINRILTGLFHHELLPMHNLAIMSKGSFVGLFDATKVAALTCRYVGTFSFYLFNVKEGSRLAPLLKACMRMQAVLNMAFRLFFGDRGAENGFTSPQLIFVGRKRR